MNRTVSRVVDVREITADERHGIEFLETPATYYDNLLDRVGKIDEDLDVLNIARI